MNSVSFDFWNLQDLNTALKDLRPALGRHHPITKSHLWPLRSVADLFNATAYARSNAERLAIGRGDLVVVLIEPTDKADVLPYDEMKDASPTLHYLDAALASYGRSFEETVVLDVRPHRNASRREAQDEISRTADDEVAYLAFEAMVEQLQPDVLLICQCQTSGAANKFVSRLSSSEERFAKLRLHILHSGKEAIVVHSFHPMYALRSERLIDRTLRDALFNLTVAMALNATVGRLCQGFGIINLRDAVRDGGPVAICASGKVELTYRRMDESCIASPALLEKLKTSAISVLHDAEQWRLNSLMDHIWQRTNQETAHSPLQSISDMASTLPSNE